MRGVGIGRKNAVCIELSRSICLRTTQVLYIKGTLHTLYFPPNQLEMPLLASLAFFSTVASNLSTPFISSLPVLSLYSLALASASSILAFASAVCSVVS